MIAQNRSKVCELRSAELWSFSSFSSFLWSWVLGGADRTLRDALKPLNWNVSRTTDNLISNPTDTLILQKTKTPSLGAQLFKMYVV